jgi:hypothetical protein
MSFLRRTVHVFRSHQGVAMSASCSTARAFAPANAAAFFPRARFFSTAEGKKPETETEPGAKVSTIALRFVFA